MKTKLLKILHDLIPFKFTETCFTGHDWLLLVNVSFVLENDMYSAIVECAFL